MTIIIEGKMRKNKLFCTILYVSLLTSLIISLILHEEVIFIYDENGEGYAFNKFAPSMGEEMKGQIAAEFFKNYPNETAYCFEYKNSFGNNIELLSLIEPHTSHQNSTSISFTCMGDVMFGHSHTNLTYFRKQKIYDCTPSDADMTEVRYSDTQVSFLICGNETAIQDMYLYQYLWSEE